MTRNIGIPVIIAGAVDTFVSGACSIKQGMNSRQAENLFEMARLHQDSVALGALALAGVAATIIGGSMKLLTTGEPHGQ